MDIVALEGVSKRFIEKGRTWSIDRIVFKVTPGECLSIIGENGSGKSTLLKMVGGVDHTGSGDCSCLRERSCT